MPKAAGTILSKGARTISKREGDALLTRGDCIGGVFLVLNGELSVYTYARDGRESVLYKAGGGESCIFALNALFGNVAYPAWVRVSSESVALLYVEGACFRALFETEPLIRDWVFSVQSQRVFDLVSTIEALQTQSLEERLKSHLIRSMDSQNVVKR